MNLALARLKSTNWSGPQASTTKSSVSSRLKVFSNSKKSRCPPPVPIRNRC